jgi:general secretion pathway protein L
MARYVGIDIGATQIKVAVVRGTVRKYVVERLVAIDRSRNDGAILGAVDVTGAPLVVQTTEDVLREAAKESAEGGDPLSVGFDGSQTYVRSLEIPAAVRRRLAEVLPFELEAQLPCDIDDAVFDHRARVGTAASLPQPVLVAAARMDQVRERIDLVLRTLGREPDHVAPGAFPLADLAAALTPFRHPGARAIVDLGYDQSELLVLEGAEPVFARTLSRGVFGMPQSAAFLAREIRQTFSAYKAAGGTEPSSVFITGGGALVHDLSRWLAGELQLPVENLPLAEIEGLEPEKRPDAHRFARAVGIALAGNPRRRGLDLRRGPLSFERGYGFIREKIPLLVGLGATILVSFLFATWARARNLNADRKTLELALMQTTRDVLGEATSDVERTNELLSSKAPAQDDDPLPRADAMDVLVQISELIPTGTMKHDIEKLDVSRQPSGGFKVTIQGVAPTGADVSTIESNLKAFRCFQNPTVTKKTKAIADDRQKYTLETELRCPEEGGGPKKPPTPGGAASGGK